MARKLREAQTAHLAGLPSEASRYTLGGFLDYWLTEVLPSRAGVASSNTIENYTWAVRRHIIPDLGPIKLTKLRPGDVAALLLRKRDAGMARNSMMRIRAVLAMALRHAEVEGLLARNVARLVEVPAGREPEGRSLTLEQARHLLVAIRGHRWEGPIVVMLMLGLRPGEALGLAWADVDEEAGTLTVRRALKRAPNGATVLGEPKTAKSRRTVTCRSPLSKHLRHGASCKPLTDWRPPPAGGTRG
ncbi:hypothetical protein BH18ACT1_BH18ACT1_12920 [soil metagenome]